MKNLLLILPLLIVGCVIDPNSDGNLDNKWSLYIPDSYDPLIGPTVRTLIDEDTLSFKNSKVYYLADKENLTIDMIAGGRVIVLYGFNPCKTIFKAGIKRNPVFSKEKYNKQFNVTKSNEFRYFCNTPAEDKAIQQAYGKMLLKSINDEEYMSQLRAKQQEAEEKKQREANALMNLGAIIGGAGTPAPSSTRSKATTPSYPTYTSSRTVPSNQLCPQLASRLVKQEVVRGNRICYYQ
tara:strand:+ start:597 stop:1307 length:711 start_codon:yes stop_codon:yes gene_type:complete